MDHIKHYTLLIQKAQSRGLSRSSGVYVERHHIIPKSVGGSDNESNLVYLTAREHFVAHLLLAKIYGGKLIFAAWAMANQFNSFQQRYYRISSYIYESLKVSASLKISKIVSKSLSGRSQKESHKQKRKQSFQKFLLTPEGDLYKQSISQRMKSNNPTKGGLNHTNADHNIYTFFNVKDNTVFIGKRIEFTHKHSISSSKVEGIIKGRKTREGWIILPDHTFD